jgi:hypothetical protein
VGYRDKINYAAAYYALVFEIFMGVIQSVVVDQGRTIKVIVHLSALQINRLMGGECENYYRLTEDGCRESTIGCYK